MPVKFAKFCGLLRIYELYLILKDGLPISRVTTNKNFQIQKSSLRFFCRFLTKTRNFADKYKKVKTNVANANEEWPLGKLFLPWTMVSWSPWQFRSCLPFSSSFKNLKISYSLAGFPWVWGQHLELKQDYLDVIYRKFGQQCFIHFKLFNDVLSRTHEFKRSHVYVLIFCIIRLINYIKNIN